MMQWETKTGAIMGVDAYECTVDAIKITLVQLESSPGNWAIRLWEGKKQMFTKTFAADGNNHGRAKQIAEEYVKDYMERHIESLRWHVDAMQATLDKIRGLA